MPLVHPKAGKDIAQRLGCNLVQVRMPLVHIAEAWTCPNLMHVQLL